MRTVVDTEQIFKRKGNSSPQRIMSNAGGRADQIRDGSMPLNKM